MRRSTWTPSIVPEGGDQTVYLVADHLGRLGDVWRETNCETTDLEMVIQASRRTLSLTDSRFVCLTQVPQSDTGQTVSRSPY